MSRKLKIALLGIDGSGKSTVSLELKRFLEEKGYEVKIIPFHKWIFADKLRSTFGRVVDRDRKGRTSPYSPKKNSFSSFIKPPIAFIDNILFYWINSPRKNNQVYIYDRFICATQIKFKALNYRVDWFKSLWMNIKPDIAFVFSVNVLESIKRQKLRNDPYTYTEDQLVVENYLYSEFSKKHNYPIIENMSKEETIEQIRKTLQSRFNI